MQSLFRDLTKLFASNSQIDSLFNFVILFLPNSCCQNLYKNSILFQQRREASLDSSIPGPVTSDAESFAPNKEDSVETSIVALEDFVRPEVQDDGVEQVEAEASVQVVGVEASDDRKADVSTNPEKLDETEPGGSREEDHLPELEELKKSPSGSGGENISLGKSEQIEDVEPRDQETHSDDRVVIESDTTNAASKRRTRARRTAPEPEPEADSATEEPQGRRSLRKRAEKPEPEPKKRKQPEPKEKADEPAESRIKNLVLNEPILSPEKVPFKRTKLSTVFEVTEVDATARAELSKRRTEGRMEVAPPISASGQRSLSSSPSSQRVGESLQTSSLQPSDQVEALNSSKGETFHHSLA